MRHTYHSVMHSGPIYSSMSLFLCMISPEGVVLRHQVKARGQSSERKHPRLYKPQHYCITIPSSHSSFLFTLNLLDCIYMLISIYWISLSFVSGMLQWQQWCWGLQVCYGSIRRWSLPLQGYVDRLMALKSLRQGSNSEMKASSLPRERCSQRKGRV